MRFCQKSNLSQGGTIRTFFILQGGTIGTFILVQNGTIVNSLGVSMGRSIGTSYPISHASDTLRERARR